MPEVAVVTDSVACLNRQLVDEYGIIIIPINILVDGKVHRDWVDITPSDAYRLLEKDPDHFATSPASPADYADVFRSLCRDHAGIVCVTISSKLSTLYNVALVAVEQLQRELPNCRIEVLDSRTATAAEGFVALAAARAAKEGKHMAEVVHTAREVSDKVNMLAVLNTVRYVYRTGRVPKIVSQVGALLNVKPMLTIPDGAVHFLGASRTKQHAVENMLARIHRDVDSRPVHMVVMQAANPEEGQQLLERVRAEFNCVELWLSEFSPVMGYATGPGVLALAYYCE